MGAGVGARAGGPLPVELVVDDVTVHEQVQEVPGADPPVDVQRLGEETRRQQTRPVVHPALVTQLAHGRVDDRVAGPPVPPRGDVPGGVVLAAPPVVPCAVVPPGRLGPGRQHLVVEVPPAQLTDEGLRARTSPRACPVDGLDRGERPEVEVGRQP
uniref:Putative deoxiribopirymidine photolyase n=1 Tax=Streptomyces sp. 139 TaxID=203783 RepID=D2CFR3_9ACTN|nr:putative deoxiribopirymidine photolyase [Streptomyces sp. 139]